MTQSKTKGLFVLAVVSLLSVALAGCRSGGTVSRDNVRAPGVDMPTADRADKRGDISTHS